MLGPQVPAELGMDPLDAADGVADPPSQHVPHTATAPRVFA
jgi:hypothetical protein